MWNILQGFVNKTSLDSTDYAKSSPVAVITPPKPFLIVSLDGGGVRGALQMRLLWRLCQRLPWLEQRIDMFAGTSAGALLAGGCAYRSLEQALPLASEDNYREVFHWSWQQEAESADGWYAARYSSEPLRRVLRRVVDPLVPVHACHKALLLTTFRVAPASAGSLPPDAEMASGGDNDDDNDKNEDEDQLFVEARCWRPEIVHNLDDSRRSGHCNDSLLETMIRSASAPTYFPVCDGCVDGGIVATNPCMFAATYALRFGKVDSLDQLLVLSIGTGTTTQNMSKYGDDASLGRAQWLPDIVDVLMQANTEGATLQCHALLGERRFRRLQVHLDKSVDLDDASAVPYLLAAADSVDLDPIVAWLERSAVCPAHRE